MRVSAFAVQTGDNNVVPANLTPQYFEAEERFKKAADDAERLEALQRMLRVIPKHKGTEKMQADLKRRISRLRKSQAKKASGSTQRPYYQVDKEGTGRVVLCGAPNSGKSFLLRSLTAAHPEVADYPFTTRLPMPGMMVYEDVQIQLVDTPPLAEEVLEAWQLAMIEQTDVALVLFDIAAPDLLERTEFIVKRFEQREIAFQSERRPKILVLANKVDSAEDQENFRVWADLFGTTFAARSFAAHREAQREALRADLFHFMDIVRVYTKAPGKKLDSTEPPFTLNKGSTVLDAAAAVHKDLARGFKFARIWAEGKYDGQMVERDHVLDDRTVLEIHT